MSPLNEEYIRNEDEADAKQSYLVVYAEFNALFMRWLFTLVLHETYLGKDCESHHIDQVG